MIVIANILRKLTYKRLKERTDQLANLYKNPLYTVYPSPIEIGMGEKKNILVFTPHADDETFGAGGAIRQHIQAGDNVHVVLFSDNVASVSNPGKTFGKITEMRENEFTSAMGVLGVGKYDVLRLSDVEFRQKHGKNKYIASLLVENPPDVLYLPSLFDNHQDHRILNLWTGNALKQIQHSGILCRGYEVWSPLPATAVLDISPVIEVKQQAISCYKSQLENIRYDHHITGLNAYRAMTFGNNAQYAEAFLETPAADYISLVMTYLES